VDGRDERPPVTLVVDAGRAQRRSGCEGAAISRQPLNRTTRDSFSRVVKLGLALPNVELTTKYDGSPVLKVGGCFVAGLAKDRAAEPDTLVVRVDSGDRESLLEDAPDTYYITDYHRPYPVVLVRLCRIETDALRDLLSVSYHLALAKTRKGAQTRRRRESAVAVSNRD
jgi:hypothetical protein